MSAYSTSTHRRTQTYVRAHRCDFGNQFRACYLALHIGRTHQPPADAQSVRSQWRQALVWRASYEARYRHRWHLLQRQGPGKLQVWYKKHLGIDVQEWGGTAFRWTDENGTPLGGTTVWSVGDGSDFAPGKSSFMVNYRVEDLHELLKVLRAEGCNVLEKVDESEYGKFGWPGSRRKQDRALATAGWPVAGFVMPGPNCRFKRALRRLTCSLERLRIRPAQSLAEASGVSGAGSLGPARVAG